MLHSLTTDEHWPRNGKAFCKLYVFLGYFQLSFHNGNGIKVHYSFSPQGVFLSEIDLDMSHAIFLSLFNIDLTHAN